MAGPEGAGGRRREASLFGVTRGLGMLGDSVAVGLSKITSRDGSKVRPRRSANPFMITPALCELPPCPLSAPPRPPQSDGS